MKKPRVSMIVAMGERNRVIGRNNALPWSKPRLPQDMARLVGITTGYPVIMGRHTWESIDERYRPLVNRANIVVTRDTSLEIPGVRVVHSVYAAIAVAEDYTDTEMFLMGGQKIYELGKARAERIYATLVDEDAEGDTFFPDYSEFSKIIEEIVVPDSLPRLTFQIRERP